MKIRDNRFIWIMNIVDFFKRLILVLFCCFPLFSVYSQDEKKIYECEWIFAESKISEDGFIEGGIFFRMEKGWHSYGPEPGDFGMPPRMKLTGEGVEMVEIKYPPAKEFKDAAGTSYGYENSFLVKCRIKINDIEKAQRFRIMFDVLLCKDVCIPVSVCLDVNLPESEEKETVKDKWLEAMRTGGWED